jgi:hypothetical protein
MSKKTQSSSIHFCSSVSKYVEFFRNKEKALLCRRNCMKCGDETVSSWNTRCVGLIACLKSVTRLNHTGLEPVCSLDLRMKYVWKYDTFVI